MTPAASGALRVGLTGGVASGKSAVARLLAARGAAVRDADDVVASLYAAGMTGARAVEGLFGRGVLSADGSVDRRRLAALVLSDDDRRRRLEAAVHPLVREEVGRWFASLAAPTVAVLEAALLVETGSFRDYHRLVVVSAPLDARRRRALAAGWDADTFDRTVRVQAGDAARAAVADYVVVNGGDAVGLERRVAELWPLLVDDAAAIAGGVTLPPRHG
ncbi:MAG: dephospho-CoA kinase [Acidobacteriota bacterium]